MNSVLESLRRNTKIDSNEERSGLSCGRRWAATSATTDELRKLVALADCPPTWFDDIDGSAVITPARLVDLIGDATQTSLEASEFWKRHFGDSDHHAAMWKTPAFTRGFVIGAVEIWNERSVPAPETDG